METCSGYFCQVYPAEDDAYACELDRFSLAEGYEILDGSPEALEQGIIEAVNRRYGSLKAGLEEARSSRRNELIGRLVCQLGETKEAAELYDTLSGTIGMTDEEIRACGAAFLVPFFDQAAYAQTIAEYLIETGTESTGSGNWTIPFEEVNQRYGVDLPSDNVLLKGISRHLYDRSDSVADFCITDEGVDLDFYYGRCPHYCSDDPKEETDADLKTKITDRLESGRVRQDPDGITVELAPAYAGQASEEPLPELTQREADIRCAEHTLWLLGAGGAQADFSGCHLHGIDLSHRDLTHALFHGTRFVNASLNDSDFSGGEFSDAVFLGCECSVMTVREADLSGAAFTDSDLSYSVFEKANLSRVRFRNTPLKESILRGCCVHGINFGGAELDSVTLEGCHADEEAWEAAVSGQGLQL